MIYLYGDGELAEISERFTGEQYLEILEGDMMPSVMTYALIPCQERVTSMQDNCPIHTDRIATWWFQDQRNLQLLAWPTKPCDQNPTENVWANTVNLWEAQQEWTSRKLLAHVQTEWEGLRRKTVIFYNHVTSVPERLREVIRSNDGWTVHYL